MASSGAPWARLPWNKAQRLVRKLTQHGGVGFAVRGSPSSDQGDEENAEGSKRGWAQGGAHAESGRQGKAGEKKNWRMHVVCSRVRTRVVEEEDAQ